MDIKCELSNYIKRNEAYEAPKVIVKDAGFDSDFVVISIKETKDSELVTAKLSGKELIAAVTKCMDANWPYH